MKTRAVPAIITSLFVVDGVLGAAYLADYLLGEPHWKLTQLLDLDGERSIASWYSSIKLFCIGALAALFVRRKIRWPDYRSWLLAGLPALFVFLSLDESVGLHEWLGRRSDALLPGGNRDNTSFDRTGIWMFVIGGPFVIVVSVWLWSIRRYIDHPSGVLRRLVVGMAVFLSGALGFEVLANYVPETRSVGHVMQVFCEEILELIGSTVMLWSAHDMAVASVSRVEARPPKSATDGGSP